MDEQTKVEKYWAALITQQEAEYIPLSTSRGKACANCRWFCSSVTTYEGDTPHDACHLVSDYPESILPTGYCNRWEGKPQPDVPEIEPVPVVIVEPPMGEGDSQEMALTPEKQDSILNKVATAVRKVFQKKAGDFAIYKDAEGNPRWIGKFTNNFQDRTKEIISDEALDGYLSRVEAGLVPLPELRLGHIPGSKHGQADMVFGVGNFLVAVGSFDDTDLARACIKYYEKYAAQTPLSHGFIHPEWAFKDGVYTVVNIFEVSTLPPPMVAANPYTEFEVTDMKQIREEQLQALALVVGGKDKAESLIDQWKEQSEELKAIGVAYKDFADVDAAQTVEKSEEKPANFVEVFLSLVEDFGTSVEVQKAFKARQDSFDAKIEAAKAEVATQVETVQKALTDATALIQQLKADRADAPRIASEDPATGKGITPEMETILKQQLPENNGYDPLFGDMKVPKK